MVDSYEERKRRARIELIKRRRKARNAPKVNKDIKIRQGNRQTIGVNKIVRLRLRDYDTIDDLHDDIQEDYDIDSECFDDLSPKQFLEMNRKWRENSYDIDNPPLTDLQKKLGRNVVTYERANFLRRDLYPDDYDGDYESNPFYEGHYRLPGNPSPPSVYNIKLHWKQDGSIQSIIDEINDVLNINVNAFYQETYDYVGELQATHLRKLIPAFMSGAKYYHDGRFDYLEGIFTEFQRSRWSKIGALWASIFMGAEKPNFDNDYLIELSRDVQNVIRTMPGLEEDTVLIRFGELFDADTLEAGDISNFAGFAFSSYDPSDIFSSYGDREGRYRLTVLAPKGTKGISTGIQNYMGMSFHHNTGLTEFIHSLNQKFIVLSIDKVNHEALLLLVDNDTANLWKNRNR